MRHFLDDQQGADVAPDAPADAVSTPKLRTRERHSQLNRDQPAPANRESNARTYARWLRRTIVRGDGVRVFDAEGRPYYDCLAAAGTLALGHNHPEVCAAVRQAIDDGIAWQTLDLATPAKEAFTDALF